MSLHTGKLICEAKTNVTEEMDERIAVLAKQARCQPAELLREVIYKGLTGKDRKSVV